MASSAEKNKSIVIGADHAGFMLKERLKAFLIESGYSVVDVGCHNTDSVDYPQIGYSVAIAMQKENIEKGVLVCGSGIGVNMAANRFSHVRAVVARDLSDALWSRKHNDANVICFGGRMTAPELASDILKTWLETPFEGGRHGKRTQMLSDAPVQDQEKAPHSC